MDQFELQKIVEEVSLESFGKPFCHKAIFNNRLQTTGGRYILKSHDIELNPKYYQERGVDELVAIIKHELCHYHLHIEGKGYKHRDQDFRNLLKKVDAPRFCKPLESVKRRKVSKQYLYVCKNCGLQYIRKRKVDIKRYACGKCSGKLMELSK
ncbi:SprT family protein [Fredinandcohnia quinoae]|uniref:Protein SprT-like n=1 Tax=Fredinandcohnia quinoae TaxID=2918902 RepID=A0AAW5EBJ0_9BACI|nr:SprT family protein [Fredinandcohnia sp. SECRCQ15]MCH1627247.1 SprT family protein [Fredinandcohnia sp. SECRCQ15]